MPNNKRHHYVPQFYLRNFSQGGCSEFIRVYNLKSARHIECAPIVGQCYKNYFYGKDLVLESSLCVMEGRAAGVLKEAIYETKLPRRLSREWRHLFEYLVIQLGRTVSAENDLNNMVENFAKYMIFNTNPELALDGVRIGWKHAIQRSVGGYLLLGPVLHDLRCIILYSARAEFIASDNPVVLINQAQDHTRTPSALGLGSTGLEIYLPISPDCALFWFDKDRYALKSRRGEVCEVFPSDVFKLNVLQFANANSNIYYHAKNTAGDIDAVAAKFERIRAAKWPAFSTRTIEQSHSHKRDQVIVSRPRVMLLPSFNFISVRRSKQPAPDLRDEVWAMMVDEFARGVDSGRFRYENFSEFLASHPLAGHVTWLNEALAG